MQHIQGTAPTAERGQSGSGSPTPSSASDALQLPPTLSPPVSQQQQQQQQQQQPSQQQLAADLDGSVVAAGSLQQAIGGALPSGRGSTSSLGSGGVGRPGTGNGAAGSLGGAGLSGLDDVGARMAQFQLNEQYGGARPMGSAQQHMAGGGDPRLAMGAGVPVISSGGYTLSSPPPPPLHVAVGMGPAFHDQLRYRDAQIAKLAGTLAHYRAWAAQVQARYSMFNAEAARPARRIYVGGLPAGTQELELRQYVNDLLIKTGGAAAPGFPINSCKLYPEKNFAFLEFRSVEEASNCMAFDGIAFGDCYLKIRRPNNYEPDVCIMLGPPDPDPTMDLTALDIVKTVVMDSPNKLFVGGLPCDWTEDQVKDILLPFGVLKAFNLVMDKNTGNSKGYAFCEYADTALTNYVIQALNGKPVGNKFLTVKRALTPAASPFEPQLG